MWTRTFPAKSDYTGAAWKLLQLEAKQIFQTFSFLLFFFKVRVRKSACGT